MDLLQEGGKAGAFLDHNKNVKEDDVRQTKWGLQRFSVFSGQECGKRREGDTDETNDNKVRWTCIVFMWK